MSSPDECPGCGAPNVRGLGGMQLNDAKISFTCGAIYRSTHDLRENRPEYGEQTPACEYAARLRRERDEAQDVAEAEHTYATIVKAENDAMREVVDAIIAWANGIPKDNWRKATPYDAQARRWNTLIDAVDAYQEREGVQHAK